LPTPNEKIWDHIKGGYKLLKFSFYYDLFRGVMMFANEAFKAKKAEMTIKRREMMYANLDNPQIYDLVHKLSE
jgi:hypothetical protein